MPPRRSVTPTEAELEILQVLWERGPRTVREVQEILDAKRPTGYTTVLKLLQVMFEKGYVTRDETERTHLYQAALAREDVQTQIVETLIEKVFGGSANELVMRALGSAGATPEELAQIRAVIERRRAEKDRKE
jgi:predicted transcriptional regulator